MRRATLAVVAAIFTATASVAAETSASFGALPDWSGYWNLGDAPRSGRPFGPPPLKPELMASLARAGAQNLDPDPLRYCRPPRFVGLSGGFTDNVEFLFTPGRVTVISEGGLVRRIYTDGRAMPRESEPSSSGTSVGRWEGKTLVIETTGIDPRAQYPTPTPGAPPIGNGVRITERITLLEPGQLEFDVTLVAPDVLTSPEHRRMVYRRSPSGYMAREVNFCSDRDRSIDPVTGKQRFDMTPPADLPPPPPG